MATGTVKWFNDAKGYGFITPEEGGKDLFVHHTNIAGEGFKTLAEGVKVEFEPREGQKGPEARAPRLPVPLSVTLFGKLEIPDAEAKQLTRTAIVERLVANGASRLTAERIVAIERGEAEASRARRHVTARR